MPRRVALSEVECEQLLAVPADTEGVLREYSFTAAELELIRLRRGDANRLGFAVQLAYMRYPGVALGAGDPSPSVLAAVATQLGISEGVWAEYGRREETRWEHRAELQAALGLRAYTDELHTDLVTVLVDIAVETDQPIAVAEEAVRVLRSWSVLLPSASRLDEAVASALTRGNRRVYDAITGALSREQQQALDGLLDKRSDGSGTMLGWLRQSPLKPNSKHAREHLRRLRAWRALDLSSDVRAAVRHSRLVKLAREGTKATVGDLGKLEASRRHATLAAVAIESQATVTDESESHLRQKHPKRPATVGQPPNSQAPPCRA